MNTSIREHNLRAAALWGSGGKAYDRISRSVSGAIEHCVERLNPTLTKTVRVVAFDTVELDDGDRDDQHPRVEFLTYTSKHAAAMPSANFFGKIANSLPSAREMKANRLHLICGTMLLTVSYATAVAANEVMTDRCSREVAFTPTFNDKPDALGTVVLTRDPNGSGSWTEPFHVSLDSSGRIRWWCHSTTGNFFDPGTWRMGDAGKLISCAASIGSLLFSEKKDDSKGGGGKGSSSNVGTVTDCADAVKPGASAFQGWTPERSRCSNHSTLIRARLGPDRLLQTECLGR
jgi:hypothetical protein